MSEITQTAPVRERSGKIASAVGIVLNFLLAASKMAVGFFTGLVSVFADGVNNLSDCGSSVISLVSFRIASKPADKEHPYGHQRAEYVAAMVISLIVFLLAFELLRESVSKIVQGSLPAVAPTAVAVLCVSFFVKGGMFFYYRSVGKKIRSDVLKAAAVDSACDCLATAAVLIGLAVAELASLPADGYAGALVALFIGWQGVGIFREATSKLLGQAPDPEMIADIRRRVLAGEGVLGLHDLHVYSYGPDKFFASVHIEMDAKVPVLVAHERIDEIERRFAEETNILLTGHLDPIVTDDETANRLREQVRAALEALDASFGLHDFRIVRGEKITKVIFDVTVPFDCPRQNGEVLEEINRKVRQMGAYDPVVTVERE